MWLLLELPRESRILDRIIKLGEINLALGEIHMKRACSRIQPKQRKQNQEIKTPNDMTEPLYPGLPKINYSGTCSYMTQHIFLYCFSNFELGFSSVQLIGSWVIEPSEDSHNQKQKIPKFLTLNSAYTWTRQNLPYHPNLISHDSSLTRIC